MEEEALKWSNKLYSILTVLH